MTRAFTCCRPKTPSAGSKNPAAKSAPASAPSISARDFKALDLEREPISKLGQFDLVICSNVLEHLSDPQRLLEMIPESLTPGGCFYLSWTNWLSPWGGH